MGASLAISVALPEGHHHALVGCKEVVLFSGLQSVNQTVVRVSEYLTQ
jgi:hypothetical protein